MTPFPPLDSLSAYTWQRATSEAIVAALLPRPVNPAFLAWCRTHRREELRLADFLAARALA